MSEITPQLIGLVADIRNLMIKIGIDLQNELRNLGMFITKAVMTGRNVGKTALGQEMGVRTKKDLFPRLGDIFKPLAQPIMPSQGGAGGESGSGLGKMLKSFSKGIKGTFASLGKTIMSSFSPMMILFQILSPLISAILEPLDLLSPLMESWGTILSQLLIPIVLAVMDVLMPFTPLLILLVEALMPILEFIPLFVSVLVPMIELVVSGASIIINIVGAVVAFVMGIVNYIVALIALVSTAIFGFFNAIASKVSEFIGNARRAMNKVFTDAINDIKAKIAQILEFFTGFWDTVKDAFSSGGALDPRTWF